MRCLRSTTKLGTSFGEELATKVSAATARLHPGYNIAAAKTGRFSSSGPNIQQIPKHKAKGLRGCFVAAPGMKLVIADYSAMELRAAAAISADEAMNVDFANGVDLHRRQAAEMLGIPQSEVTAQQRDTAKPICFGTIYGAGPRGLAGSAWANYGLVLSEDEAETARRSFLTRYPGLDAWMNRSFVRSNHQGFITIGRLGRVIEASWQQQKLADGKYNWRLFEEGETDDSIEEEDTSQRRPLQWGSVLKRTLCCNAPVQGACADAAMLALTWIDAALIEAGIAGGPVLFVHDEIVLEVPEADAERAGAMLVDCMTRAFATTFPNAPLANVVEFNIRDAWGHRPADTAAARGDLRAPVGAEQSDANAMADQRGSAGECHGADTELAMGTCLSVGIGNIEPRQTVIEGDCLDHLRTMPPHGVAVAVFSPPYNVGKEYASYGDNRPLAEYLEWQASIAAELARVMKPDGHLFLNVGWNSKHPMRAVEVMLAYAKHLVLQQSIIWTKSLALDDSSLPDGLREEMHDRQVGHFVSLNSEYYLNPTAEMIWHFSPTGRSPIDRLAIGVPYVWKDQPDRFGHGRELHCRGSTWHIPYKTTQSRADRDFHPASFPVALAERCLRLAGVKAGELVLDPFAGTGATLIAAQQLGIAAIGIEVDPGYCEAARRRLRRLGRAMSDAAE